MSVWCFRFSKWRKFPPPQTHPAFVRHWSWKYFWNSPPRWPVGNGGIFFHPVPNLSVGHVGALRKSWVFALKGSQKKIVKKIVVFPLPFEKKNNPTKKKQLFQRFVNVHYECFPPIRWSKKNFDPFAASPLSRSERLLMGACSSKFLNEGSTPHFGEKMPWKHPWKHPWKPLPLVDIYPVGHAVGGKETCHFLQWLCFCFVYFCGPIKSISKMPRKDVEDRPEWSVNTQKTGPTTDDVV